MKLLKRLSSPTLALLALALIGGCGKPLESGEGEVAGQRGRDSAALREKQMKAEEADKLLQDGYVKVGQVLSIAQYAVQAKLPGNGALASIPLAIDAAAEPAAAVEPAAASNSDSEPSSEASSSSSDEGDSAASSESSESSEAAASGEGSEGSEGAGAEKPAAEGDAAASEDHQVTAADEGLVEPAGPVMPQIVAAGSLANNMLGQAYALLDEVRAEIEPLLSGEFDAVLDDAAKDKIMSLKDLLAAADQLVYAGAYLMPINEDVVELIKQAREAAAAPAEGAEGAAPAEGEAAAVEGEAASSEAAATEGAGSESEKPAAEGESSSSDEGAAKEGEAKEGEAKKDEAKEAESSPADSGSH